MTDEAERSGKTNISLSKTIKCVYADKRISYSENTFY